MECVAAWSSRPLTPRCATTRESATATRAGRRPTAQSRCPIRAQVGLASLGPSHLYGLTGSSAGPVLPQTTWAGLRRTPCAPSPSGQCERLRFAVLDPRLSDPTGVRQSPASCVATSTPQ